MVPFLVAAAAELGAQDRALLVSGVFADSSIVGPAVRFSTKDSKGGEWLLTLLGSSLDAQFVKHRSARRAWIVSADSTPVNAHLSNRIYVEGERAHELEYEAASHRLRAGMRFTPNDSSTTDIQFVGLLEEITDIEDATVRNFWEGPFYGIDASHTYKKFSSESPLVAAFTGFLVNVRAELFGGPETWSRLTVSQRSGVQVGTIHLRQSVLVMGSRNLNVVSRSLVGGSWDVLGENALYGHRYGEYRVARGVVANAGADYGLPRNWRAGIRASYLNSDIADEYGSAVNVSKIWRTFGVNFGVGFAESRDPVVYFALVAPLYAR
ncbi:MAG TPA: hypothetical protein VKB93_03805 [Thermoanaerobaculia bacterium]|nr:hypothetical protein [Thermoanaerobaculia bacterium]